MIFKKKKRREESKEAPKEKFRTESIETAKADPEIDSYSLEDEGEDQDIKAVIRSEESKLLDPVEEKVEKEEGEKRENREKVEVGIKTEVTEKEGGEVRIRIEAVESEDGEREKISVEEKIDKVGVLRTDDLVKKYGRRTVVDHVSINVKQGEIVGLLGPNGAGKTTTFYMTVGLISPNSGRIFLDEQDITKDPVYRRAKLGIGYLAQEPSVFRKLSVENNIRAVLEMTSLSPEQQKEKLESLIKEFRLEKVRHNLGDQLSGGERRRTEIARCLAINPKFIMLDEPFAGVDPIAVEDIQAIVYRLKEKNIGILITDHNAQETLRITDRAYLLFEGRILFQGTSEELAENPVVREKYLGRNFLFYRKKFDDF